MPDQPSTPAKSPRIYLSYRRGDTAGYAGRLYEQLTEHFGAGRVMLDIEDISPGYGFDEVIKEAVSSCAAVVVLIGRSWLNSTTGEGRLIDNPADFVRLEIATALENEIPVIPVLVQGAMRPKVKDLPGEIAILGWLQPTVLNDTDWTSGVERLVRDIESRRAGGAPLGPSKPQAAVPALAEPCPLKVFVSSTGERGQKMADALSGLLVEIPSTEVARSEWVASVVSRGETTLVDALSEVDAAVVCLCRGESVVSPPKLIEIGILYGLRKNIWVYLLDADHSGLDPPLSFFIGLQADADGTRRLLDFLNGLREEPVAPDELQSAFLDCWSVVKERLDRISFDAERAPAVALTPPVVPASKAGAGGESPAVGSLVPETRTEERVFVCYARADEEFALRLATSLKDRGVRLWLDQWDIPESADWDRSIDEALYACSRFMIVLSPASVSSDEVRAELRIALDEKKTILPVLYQKCMVPRRLRLIQHFDFTAHAPDDETVVGRLVRSLTTSKRQ